MPQAPIGKLVGWLGKKQFEKFEKKFEKKFKEVCEEVCEECRRPQVEAELKLS